MASCHCDLAMAIEPLERRRAVLCEALGAFEARLRQQRLVEQHLVEVRPEIDVKSEQLRRGLGGRRADCLHGRPAAATGKHGRRGECA
jgi:hypothetical protein